jgi:hypothetical protein
MDQDRITELINKSGITSIVNSYFRALDEKNLDAQYFASIFTPKAKVTRHNGASLIGPEEISVRHGDEIGPDVRRTAVERNIVTGYKVLRTFKTREAFLMAGLGDVALEGRHGVGPTDRRLEGGRDGHPKGWPQPLLQGLR